MKRFHFNNFFFGLAVLCYFTVPATADTGNRGAWGDQGDGTYKNPVLPGDFSDPDVIRVGNDYFFITSTFQYSPGMAVMQSKDLVNWRYLGHCVSDLTQIGPELNWDRMNRYNRGIYAGALRYHDDRFWMFFTTMDEGVFLSTATNAAGPLSQRDTWGVEGEYYLTYLWDRQHAKQSIRLPDNIPFKAEVIDTWAMTITPLPGTFSGRAEIPLPSKPYQAIRLVRLQSK